MFFCIRGIVVRITQSYLYFVGKVGLHVTGWSIRHIIDENTESSDSESVQVFEFCHQSVYALIHFCCIREADTLLKSGVGSPNEVDVTAFGNFNHSA